MSSWGKLDRINLSGVTATANLNSRTVVVNGTNSLTGPFVTANVKVGDSLLLENVAYKVSAIPLANTVTLDTVYSTANSAVLTMGVQQSPKYLTTLGLGSDRSNATATARNTYGVDSVEIQVGTNKNKGISHTGWVKYHTYTNSQGTVRNKAEVVVATSKNFNRNDAGALQTDANDDGVIADA